MSPAFARRWPAAIVLMLAALMDLVDGTIVNVALPVVRADLHASATDVEWFVSAYLLAFAATLIAAGRVGDRLGRRRLFLGGVAVFGVASLLCGLAQTPAQLIAARALEGVAAGVIAPQVLGSFRAMFAGQERGAAFGLYGAVAGFAVAIGLLAGGLLTDADLFGWGWRTIFLVNLPIVVAVLALGALLVPETRDDAPGRMDVPGAALLAASLVAIVLPLLEGRRLGWPLWGWALLAGGLAGLGALAALDARRSRAGSEVAPLVPTPLLRLPAVSVGLLVQALFAASMQGVVLTATLWLAGDQGWSPTHIGLSYLILCLGSFISAPIAIPLALRFGRWVLAGGGLTMALGAGLLAWPDGSVSTLELAPGLFLFGFGLCLMTVPLINVVLSAAPAGVAGEAGGLFSTAQQLGGAIGVALVGTLFFHQGGAFDQTAPWVAAALVVTAALCLALPRTAVEDPEAEVEREAVAVA
jgi:EmrB/QacA subfamily drug resistance transporter